MQSIKVVMVGDGAVGKTSFLITYTSNSFPDEYVPTVFDEYSANLMVDGKLFSVSLWDTAGQAEYDRLRPLSYPQTNVFIVAYSVANPDSFHNVVQKWIPEIKEHCPDAPFVLFATKTDLRDNEEIVKQLADKGQSCITTEQGHDLSLQIGASGFFELSAKVHQHGIKDSIDHVIRVGGGLIINDGEPQMPLKPDPPVIANGTDVCDDLGLLVNDKLFHDVVFRVEDRAIYCHKIVLCSACSSFQKLIVEHSPLGEYFTSKTDGDVCVVSVSEVSHVELLEFIKFVYNGKAKQSPTNEFIQLAKVCDIDYNSTLHAILSILIFTVNRRTQMKKSIVANVKTMHDIEIISSDAKKFTAVKALLWCRSKHFQEQLTEPNTKQIQVEAPSSFVSHFLNFVNEGVLPHGADEYTDDDADLLQWAAQWSESMKQSIEYLLVTSVINLKNVFEWTNLTRDRYPSLHTYCVWLMRVNYSTIKDKKDFLALSEHLEVAEKSWPGLGYENRYKRWKESHGKKKDRCLVQ